MGYKADSVPRGVRALWLRNGNIFAMLFAAVAMTGVLGVVGMQTISGPVTTITKVTQKNITDTDIMTNGRIVILNAATRDATADGDPQTEPAPYVECDNAPTGGGCLPSDIGAVMTDPWGTPYGYCVWNHGTNNAAMEGMLQGTEDGSGAVIAVISAGQNKVFETGCYDYDGSEPEGLSPAPRNGMMAGGDDSAKFFTYAEAASGAGGLWSLKAGTTETATVDPAKGVVDFELGTGSNMIRFDTATGRGEFPSLRVDVLTGHTQSNVEIAGGLRLDDQSGVTACDAGATGVIRYHTGGYVQLCDGSQFIRLSPWQADSGNNLSYNAGNVSVGQNMAVTGTLAAGATTVSSLNSTGAVSGSSVAATGSVSGGSLSTTGSLTAGTSALGNTTINDLSVTGNTTLGNEITDTVTIAGNTSVARNLNVGNGVLSTAVSSGNVGIGTNAPDIASGATGLHISDTTSPAIRFQEGTENFYVGVDNGNFYIRPNSLGTASAIGVAQNGRVSIDGGTSNIALDVAGLIRVGSGNCSTEGTIQYNTTSKIIEVCDGSQWKSASGINKLSDIGDVNVTTPANGSLLSWDSLTDRWVAVNSSGVITGGSSSAKRLEDTGKNTKVNVDTAGDGSDDTIVFTNNDNQSMIITASGRVGIGIAEPHSLLHVAGGIQLGNDNAVCPGVGNVKLGALRYNGTSLQICNATGWTNVGTGGGSGGSGAGGESKGMVAYKSSPQAIAYGNTFAPTTVIFETLNTSSLSGYDTATGIFTAPESGWYQFSSSVQWDDITDVNHMTGMRIMVDSSPICWDFGRGSSADKTQTCSAAAYMSAGSKAHSDAWHYARANENIEMGRFSIVKIDGSGGSGGNGGGNPAIGMELRGGDTIQFHHDIEATLDWNVFKNNTQTSTFDPVTNKVTIGSGEGGIWMISAYGDIAGDPNLERISIYRNNTENIAGNISGMVSASTIIELQDGDTIHVTMAQNSGSVTNGSGINFHLYRLPEGGNAAPGGGTENAELIAFEAVGPGTVGTSYANYVFPTKVTDMGGNNYNPATGIYTIPSDGYYQFNASLNTGTGLQSDTYIAMFIKTPSGRALCGQYVSDSVLLNGRHLSCSGSGYFNAGDEVVVSAATANPTTVNISSAYFSGFKVQAGGAGDTGGSASGMSKGLSITGETTSSVATVFNVSNVVENDLLSSDPTNSRITIEESGAYLLSGSQSTCTSGANGYGTFSIHLNGTRVVSASSYPNSCDSATQIVYKKLTAGDVVEARCGQNSGASTSCNMNVVKLGGGSGGGGSEGIEGKDVSINVSTLTPKVVSGASPVTIDFDTEHQDTNNNFDLTNDRFTPTVAGKYLVTLGVTCPAMLAERMCSVMINKNGNVVAGDTSSGVNSSTYKNVSYIIDMNGSTDYIIASVYSNTTMSYRATMAATLLNGGGSGSGGAADNLGDHTATQDLSMATYKITDVGAIELESVTGIPAPTGISGGWSGSGDNAYRLTGNVGIGTHEPMAKLTINAPTGGAGPAGSFANYGILLYTHPTMPNSSYGMGMESSHMWFNTGGGYKFYYAGTHVSTIANNGAYSQASDLRLKENIAPVQDALAKIMALDGVTFRWKDNVKGNDIGLIAQNVQEVFPELVQTDQDGMLSVNYANLVSPLIEAVKELKQSNDQMSDRLDAVDGGGHNIPTWLLIVICVQGIAVIGLGFVVLTLVKRKK